MPETVTYKQFFKPRISRFIKKNFNVRVLDQSGPYSLHYTALWYIFPMIPGSVDPRHSCVNILFKILTKSLFFFYLFIFVCLIKDEHQLFLYFWVFLICGSALLLNLLGLILAAPTITQLNVEHI